MSDDAEMLIRVRVRVLQIISGALVLGAVIFMGIVVAIVGNGAGPPPPAWPGGQPVVTYLAITFLVVQIAIVMTLPPARVRAAVRQIAAERWPTPAAVLPPPLDSDVGKLLLVRQTALMLTLAPLEGSAFFGCIAYLLEPGVAALTVTAVAILLMLVYFPTEAGVRSWLEQQSGALSEARLEASGRA